jgi:hypothetical protein
MANNEPGLADVIVGAATSVPTSEQSVTKTRGLMAQQRPGLGVGEDPDYDLPTYIGDLLSTMRDERATMDYLKSTVDETRLDDYDYGVDEQAQRMIDSADTQYDYSSGERPATPKTPELKNALTKAKSIVEENIGITGEMWDIYRDKVGFIESSNTYNKVGGSGDHYDGYYQMGQMAKADASKILGYDLGHDKASRQKFRNDPALQEEAVAAYTAQNHSYLTQNSSKYRALPIKEKLAVLAYAHNQGWKGARDWLNTGVEGRDAFGTKGTKYYNAIIEAF